MPIGVNRSLDLTGHRYGRLVVLEYAGVYEHAGERTNALWKCRCDCGTEKVIRACALRSNRSQSCGCLQRERATKHGMYDTKAYNSWRHIIDRCTNLNSDAWDDYGGRGITVSFESFEQFYAEIGDPPAPHLTVDRIDNSRGYAPGNVRWADMTQQNLNARGNRQITFNGKTQPLSAWCKELGLSKYAIASRLHKGWSETDALSIPVRQPGDAPLTHNGKTKTLSEWAKLTGLSVEVIQHRVRRGWSPMRVLTQPKRNPPLMLTFQGRTQGVSQWCEELGIERNTFELRLRRGWTGDPLFSAPNTAPRAKRTSRKAIRDHIVHLRIGPDIRCHHCGNEIPVLKRVIDHLKPLRRGGTDTVENLVPSCIPCNASQRNVWGRSE